VAGNALRARGGGLRRSRMLFVRVGSLRDLGSSRSTLESALHAADPSREARAPDTPRRPSTIVAPVPVGAPGCSRACYPGSATPMGNLVTCAHRPDLPAVRMNNGLTSVFIAVLSLAAAELAENDAREAHVVEKIAPE